jgi:hypothetical protein
MGQLHAVSNPLFLVLYSLLLSLSPDLKRPEKENRSSWIAPNKTILTFPLKQSPIILVSLSLTPLYWIKPNMIRRQ